jgi:glyoxylase-like metal-dependent hydrolase (beta-lactamase superfamily II)
MRASLLAVALLALAVAAPASAQPFSADLAAIRQAAKAMPGALPLRINVVKFAESRRTKNFAVKGAPREPSIQARTAYQVVYRMDTTPLDTIMIDSGMDLQVHKFFGRGVEEPYFPEQEQKVERALVSARAIVVTHEHGDHIAGVIRSPDFAKLVNKTTITRTQADRLMTAPQMPEIRLTADQVQLFNVIDYDTIRPFAPGMALIKSPGHTPGSQMIYVVLQSGKEYIFAGDVAWHMDGVRQVIGKDAPWITEDEPNMTAELRWLNGLMRNEPNVRIVISHDEDQRLQYIAQGVLGADFEFSQRPLEPLPENHWTSTK